MIFTFTTWYDEERARQKSKQRVLDYLYWLAHSDAVRSNKVAYEIVLKAVRRVNGD